MSRIGKRVITVPANTEIRVSGDTVVVKGPKGELSRGFHPIIEVKVEGNEVTLNPKKPARLKDGSRSGGGTLESQALWGTYASHLTNMVKGVNDPFAKKLILEGIGFKSEVKGNELVLALGFSHPVVVAIPDGIEVKAEKNVITISGIDKEKVGEFAARVRSQKKPEPYKGKGMRYEDEVIKRKQGKKSV